MSQEAKPVVVVSDVLKMLNDGQTRDEIREYYGLSQADLKRVFENPNLKNKKSRKKPGFILEDDVTPAKEAEVDQAPERSEAQESDENVAQAPADFRNPGNSTASDASDEQGDVDGIPVR